jgi:hypothetical protein
MAPVEEGGRAVELRCHTDKKIRFTTKAKEGG